MLRKVLVVRAGGQFPCPLHLKQGTGALGPLCFIHNTTAWAGQSPGCFPLLKFIAPGTLWSQTWDMYSGFPGGSEGKESTGSAGDPSSIPGLGRSPGEGNGYPLQDSCLENSMDRGAWWGYIVHWAAKLYISHLVHITIPQRLKLGNFSKVTKILSAIAQLWSRHV